MSDTSSLVKTLLNELNQDVAHYQQLVAQLKQQHVLLVNRDNQALIGHNQQLQSLMALLNQHATNRHAILTRLGVTADNDGMQKLLKKLPQQVQQKGMMLWQNLYEQTLACQDLNNTNGRLLAQQKQLIDRLLKPEQQYCYGPGE